jgi:predicted metallo-beta-lactamase superfamily hydrolase
MKIKLYWEFYHCIIYIANEEIVINHHLLRMKTFNMTVINKADCTN